MLDSIYNMTLKVYISKSRFCVQTAKLKICHIHEILRDKYTATTALPGISAPCLHISLRAFKPGGKYGVLFGNPGNVKVAMFQNFCYTLTH